MWIKERLRLTPAELAGMGVWLSLPWTVKMVFGQLVDSVPIFGSPAAVLHPDRSRVYPVRVDHAGRCGRRIGRVRSTGRLYILECRPAVGSSRLAVGAEAAGAGSDFTLSAGWYESCSGGVGVYAQAGTVNAPIVSCSRYYCSLHSSSPRCRRKRA